MLRGGNGNQLSMPPEERLTHLTFNFRAKWTGHSCWFDLLWKILVRVMICLLFSLAAEREARRGRLYTASYPGLNPRIQSIVFIV